MIRVLECEYRENRSRSKACDDRHIHSGEFVEIYQSIEHYMYCINVHLVENIEDISEDTRVFD